MLKKIEKLLKEQYDLILLGLLDYDISYNCTGVKVLNDTKDYQDHAIYIATSGSHENNRRTPRLLEAGCDVELEKPFEMKHLLEIIKDINE